MLLLLITHVTIAIHYTVAVKQQDTSDFDLTRKPWLSSYDYIIIGGGAAGCVLARRLSENPNVTVLLIEAGPDDYDDPFIPIPRTFISVIRNKQLEWNFRTEPQPHLFRNKTLQVPYGKVLGGSTSHNGMNVVRGSRYDYDRWAELGNKGWSYADVLPYFKKSEDMTDERLRYSEYHGRDGPWPTKLTVESAFVRAYIKAGEELGYKEVDYNGETQFGFARQQHCVSPKGERMSTSRAFLKPVIMRRNLYVVVNAQATKIKIVDDNGSLRAIGVYFEKDNKEYYIAANKEVICSCGAVNTPKLLMLSGVGPKEHLQKVGLPTVADLPVGNALEDHISFHMSFWFKPHAPIKLDKTNTFETLFEYLFAGSGPWSSYASQAVSFHRTTRQPKNEKMPYIEVPMAINVWGLPENLAQKIRDGEGLNKESARDIEKRERGRVGVSAGVVLYHPRNRGSVRLRSKNYQDDPVIIKNYFENPDDLEDILEGVRIAQKIVRTQVMKDAGLESAQMSNGFCDDFTMDSDEYWKCAIRANAMPFAHFAGTCKMAPDKTGVVDERLRVKGIKGLRVVDTSIMPYIMSGHAMAPTIMIAEKASDMIKEELAKTF